MDVRTAIRITDAFSLKIHPRMDFTTEEGRSFTLRDRPYLLPLVTPGTRALDLGSSFGKNSLNLAELGAVVTGVEVSMGALRFSTALARRIGANAKFIGADYSFLPLRAGCFDLVTFPHNVVECSPSEFSAVVTEVHRVLAPGGTFTVSVANKWADPASEEPVLRDDSVTLTDRGRFAYPTYSWSAKAVQRAVVALMPMVHMADMPERAGTWMVFTKYAV